MRRFSSCFRGAAVATLLAALSWAPAVAGKRIAFLKLTDPFWQVWVMDAGGGGATQVTRSARDKMRVSWFPDGRRIVYNATPGELWIADLKTLQETRIPIDMEGMTDGIVSPDGAWIAFSASIGGGVDNNDIWIVRPDGSGARRLTDEKGLQHYPCWSAGGERLYYLSGEGKDDHDIMSLEIATGSSTQITAGSRYHFDLAVSSGGLMAFSSNRTGDYDLWIAGSDGGAERTLVPAPGLDGLPSWSPDGSWILFTSMREGSPALWRVRPDGSGLKRLTKSNVRARGGVWEP